MSQTVFSSNLALLRRQLGVSQKEAAAALGISQSLLSHYEKGIREPGLDFLCRAADYYHTSLDFLLGRIARQPSRTAFELVQNTAMLPLPDMIWFQAEEDLMCCIEVIFNILNHLDDPDISANALNLLADVVYEEMRLLTKMGPDSAQEFFILPDPSFNSGAVVSDSGWLRSHLFQSCVRYREEHGSISGFAPEIMEQRFPYTFQAVRRLIQVTGVRICSPEFHSSAEDFNSIFSSLMSAYLEAKGGPS